MCSYGKVYAEFRNGRVMETIEMETGDEQCA